MAEGRLHLPKARLILAAAVLGALAGGVAVYVTGGPSGNLPLAPPGSEAEIAACAGKAEKATALAAEATGDVAAMLAADPPVSLKAVAFKGPDGAPMTLADRMGKTVLVNLWATWCLPCREEMPALDALQKQKGSEKFEVVALNVDLGDDVRPRKFLAETAIGSLAYYRDNSFGVFNDLKSRGLLLGLPATYLIDADGCLLAYMNGPADWSGEDAARLIDAATAS